MSSPNNVLPEREQTQAATAAVSPEAIAAAAGVSELGRDAKWIAAALLAVGLVGVGGFLAATGTFSQNADDPADLAPAPAEVIAEVESPVDELGQADNTADSTAAPADDVALTPAGAAEPEVTEPVEVDSAEASVAESEPASDPDPVPDPVAVEPEAVEPAAVEPEVVAPEDTTPAPDAASEVPESKATVRNGQIFLEGAVPSQAEADELVALASEILGPDNVFSTYTVDPRAGDASLGNITVEDTINFTTNSTAVSASAEPLLNQGLALLTIRPSMTITIVGHTDSRGSETSNVELSLARAESVKAWFVDRGVAPDRLFAEGAGSSQPIADNATTEGQELNRRIQFFLENILGDA